MQSVFTGSPTCLNTRYTTTMTTATMTTDPSLRRVGVGYIYVEIDRSIYIFHLEKGEKWYSDLSQ